MNEDTVLRDGELIVAVYVKNIGGETAKNIMLNTVIMDEDVKADATIPSLKAGDTKRTVFYLPFDVMPDEYYLKTGLLVDNVKKTRYSRVLIY